MYSLGTTQAILGVPAAEVLLGLLGNMPDEVWSALPRIGLHGSGAPDTGQGAAVSKRLESSTGVGVGGGPPNKAMKLTRLTAAPGTPTQGAAVVAPRARNRGHRLAAYRQCSTDIQRRRPSGRGLA